MIILIKAKYEKEKNNFLEPNRDYARRFLDKDRKKFLDYRKRI